MGTALLAAYLAWVFIGKEGGIATGDGEAGCAAFEGCAHAVVEPTGGVVETGFRGKLIAHEGGFVVGVEGGDEGSAGQVGLLSDFSGERDGVEGGGHDEFLAVLEAESYADGNLGEVVELLVVS